MVASEDPLTPVQIVINGVKLLLAMSPLIALFYVIYTGFEDEEKENAKRRQKGDFALDGHGE